MKQYSPKDGYNLYASDYRKDHPLLDSFMSGAELEYWENAVTAQLESNTSVKTLELGCGDGRTLLRCFRRIENRGWTDRVTLAGTDVSSRMLDLARRRLGRVPLGLLDAMSTPACESWSHQNGPAQVVSAWFLLVHIANLSDFFEAANALVSPGGILIANSIPQPSAPELRAHGKPMVIEAWDHKANEVAKTAAHAGWIEQRKQDFFEAGQLVSSLFVWQKPLETSNR